MDVTDDASVAKAIEVLLEREGRLDVVVNNAGIGLAGSIEDTEVEEARALFETNFFGVHRVCRHVLPILRGQGGGLLVNIGSIAGVVTIPFQGLYSASKYALEALSDALRMECAAFGVRVVLIEPGDFQTGFTGSRAFAAASGGGSVYRERCERAVATMAHDERNGAQPEQLAALLERVVEGRARGSRYLCGKLADRAIGRLAPWLPARLVDRGLLAYYG
jgi:NAD(P)-dependent dehydrogenase (short-subunit alcohol dehydrogenase family)